MGHDAPDRDLGRRGLRGAGGSVVHKALLHLGLASLVTIVIVTLATLVVAERIARSIALDEARAQAETVAARLAAPLVDEQVREGAPGAAEELETVLANRMADGSLRHLKLWDESGRIVWSDQREVAGRTCDLPAEAQALFGTRRSVAEVSDLASEETVAEREGGGMELLEVYVGAFDRDGRPLVVEAYLPTEEMEQDAQKVLTPFVTLTVGSLVLLLLMVLPVVLSLSRRVQRAQVKQATLMRDSLLTSELERRRIAEDLHHGVVQELAGIGYTLPAAVRHLEKGGNPEKARALLLRATDLVQHNITALRSLMTDIYPPDLRGSGLHYAVRHLVENEALAAGLEGRVELDDELDIPADAGSLAYRIVREGVRNVVKHAEARQLVVALSRDGSDLTVRIDDDGRGPGDHAGQSPDGHLGLRLLRDAVHDAGGRFAVQRRDEGGTSLVARFPLGPLDEVPMLR